MGRVIVRYQGIIASIVEASREYYDLSDLTLRSLLNSMSTRHGYDFRKLIKENPTYFVLVDERLIDLDRDADMKLSDESRVDLMMAVAGGEPQPRTL